MQVNDTLSDHYQKPQRNKIGSRVSFYYISPKHKCTYDQKKNGTNKKENIIQNLIDLPFDRDHSWICYSKLQILVLKIKLLAVDIIIYFPAQPIKTI